MKNSWGSLYWLVICSAVSALLGMVVVQNPSVQLMLLAVASLTIIAAIALIVWLLTGTDELGFSSATCAVLVLINGGAIADIYATLYHSPDLALESNPIVRLLFSVGFGLDGILIIGFAFQVAICVFISSLFVLMVSRHGMLMASVNEVGVLPRIVQILAGPNRNVIDFITGRVVPEYGLAAIAFVLSISCIYRWYLAAEWFGLVPISRIVAPGLILLSSLIGYVIYSYRCVETIRRV